MPDAFAGMGFGALVGCLLGFSTQNVVAGAIAGVVTLVASFIGVSKPAAFAPASGTGNQDIRIMAFGITATVLFLASYYVSINHLIEPSPKDIKESLVRAGYTDTDAKIMFGSKYFGVQPEGWKKYSP